MQGIVERTDQQRALVAITDHDRLVAPRVVTDHAVDHPGEKFRQDALIVDAVGRRHDDGPVAELFADLSRHGGQAVVLHRQHDDIDVGDVARPIDYIDANGAPRFLRLVEGVGGDAVLTRNAAWLAPWPMTKSAE